MFTDKTVLTQNGVLYHGSFKAFGHRCELQLETSDKQIAQQLLDCVSTEVNRIAEKYCDDLNDNLYDNLNDNIMSRMNRGTAESIIVDTETAGLLDFSDACFQLSEGKFDICCSAIQSFEKVPSLNKRLSWQSIRWDNPRLRLLQGMQLTFDAFIKAHASDRALSLANEISKVPMLFSIGGLHLSNKPRISTGDWWLEHLKSTSRNAAKSMQFEEGAIVTLYSVSRETDAYTYFDGQTNQAITESPIAITVAAPNCTEANMLATLAMLEGHNAEQYLKAQQAIFWLEAQ